MTYTEVRANTHTNIHAYTINHAMLDMHTRICVPLYLFVLWSECVH